MIAIVAGDGVIRERLPDEALLVFLSGTHIGGSSGSDIFESAAEFTMRLEELHGHEGPVELVLATSSTCCAWGTPASPSGSRAASSTGSWPWRPGTGTGPPWPWR